MNRPELWLEASILTCAVLIAAPPVLASEDAPKTAPEPVHHVRPASSSIEIDGRIDESAWTDAISISLDYETDPGENVPAPVATECLITYDSDRLYVAFRASDPEPGDIRARLADRDDAFDDDYVGIVLDTFDDGRRAFQFFVNPLGVQMDQSRNDIAEDDDSSWDAIWDSAGRLTATGYEVELAVPFSSLPFPRTEGPQTWGVDALRIYPRSSRHRLANNPQDRDVDCYVCQFSKLTGFDGITPGRNLEINPTFTAGRGERRQPFPDGPFEDGDETSDLGLNISWGVTPNLNLAGTVNPDFSQVEADVAQLDVNRQFALFFPERRPFFLDDADLFDTVINAVFTRNVADPSWGLRLTGKEGKNAVGVFVAEDELTNLIFPGNQGSSAGSFDFTTRDAVLRYRRDLRGNSNLGALVTSREGGGYSNLVAGFDGLLRFGESDSLSFQFLQSRTEYPAAVAAEFDQPVGSFDDHYFHATYVHSDRDWRWWVVYDDVGDGFRADMGFEPRVGFRHPRGGIQRTWWGGDDDWYNRIRAGVNYDRVEERSGQRLEESYETWANVTGPMQSYLEVFVFTRDRHFNGVDFNEDQISSYTEFQPAGKLFLGLWTVFGGQVDFANTQQGDIMILEPTLRLDFGKHLRTRLEHEYRRLDVDGGTLFEANLTQGRILYQINLRTFVRAVFQYTDVVRDPALYTAFDVEPKTEQLFTQLLFSYKLNPRTVLFLGYSDNYRGDDRIDLTQENRALFLKIGYAWVL